jgi:hypothetical protein
MAWGDIIPQTSNQQVDRKEMRQYVDIKAYTGDQTSVWWYLGDYAEDAPVTVDMSPEKHVDVKGKPFVTVGDIVTSQTFDTYYVSTGIANNTHGSTNFFQSWLTEIFMSGKETDLINSVPYCLCYTYLEGKEQNNTPSYAATMFPASSIKFGSVGGAGNSNLSIGISITAGGGIKLGSSTGRPAPNEPFTFVEGVS